MTPITLNSINLYLKKKKKSFTKLVHIYITTSLTNGSVSQVNSRCSRVKGHRS